MKNTADQPVEPASAVKDARAEIRPLTGLRGLAVAIVFVSHAANEGHLPDFLGNGVGQMGVQIFFALSGFLMMHLYGNAPASGVAARRFIVSRIARVAPLYLAVVLFSAGMISLYPDYHYRIDSLQVLGLAVTFVGAPQELWSVPVEVQFYAVFLALWCGLGCLSERLGLLLWGILAAIALACLSKLLADALRWFILYAHVFLLGALLAMPAIRCRLRAVPIGWLGIGAGLLVILSLPALHPAEIFSGFYPRFWLDPLRLAATVTVLAFAVQDGPVARRLLGGRGLLWLGQISFALYLFHRPILIETGNLFDGMPGVGVTVLAFAAAAGLAGLSLIWLERPAAAFIRFLARDDWLQSGQRSRIARSHAGDKAMSPAGRGLSRQG